MAVPGRNCPKNLPPSPSVVQLGKLGVGYQLVLFSIKRRITTPPQATSLHHFNLS